MRAISDLSEHLVTRTFKILAAWPQNSRWCRMKEWSILLFDTFYAYSQFTHTIQHNVVCIYLINLFLLINIYFKRQRRALVLYKCVYKFAFTKMPKEIWKSHPNAEELANEYAEWCQKLKNIHRFV